MPALVPTDHAGTVTWLGRVAREVGRDLVIHGEPPPEMPLTFAGYAGEVHAGLTRPSCSRVTRQHPRGTTIRNVRQVCVMGAEELAAVAAELGLDALDPAWAGAGWWSRASPTSRTCRRRPGSRGRTARRSSSTC